jgi:hypothetical protein
MVGNFVISGTSCRNLLVTAGHATPGCLSVVRSGGRAGEGEAGGGGGGGGGAGDGEPDFGIWMQPFTVRNHEAYLAWLTCIALGQIEPALAEPVYELWFCGAGKYWSIPFMCKFLVLHVFSHHEQKCHIKAADIHTRLYYANRQLELEGGAPIDGGDAVWCCSCVLISAGDAQWTNKNVGQVFKMDLGDETIDPDAARPGVCTLLSGYQVLEHDGQPTNPGCHVLGVAFTAKGVRVWNAKAAAEVEIDTKCTCIFFGYYIYNYIRYFNSICVLTNTIYNNKFPLQDIVSEIVVAIYLFLKFLLRLHFLLFPSQRSFIVFLISGQYFLLSTNNSFSKLLKNLLPFVVSMISEP